jgi:hypothetical protein
VPLAIGHVERRQCSLTKLTGTDLVAGRTPVQRKVGGSDQRAWVVLSAHLLGSRERFLTQLSRSLNATDCC